MYIKKIKCKDYNGNDYVETAYFQLNKAEVVKLQASEIGGMEQKIRRLIQVNDQPELMRMFEEMIDLSYGVKGADNRSFIKRQDGKRLVDDWKQTEAYSEFFMQLLTDTDEVIRFVNGIMPSDMPKPTKAELLASIEAVAKGEDMPAPVNVFADSKKEDPAGKNPNLTLVEG